MFSDRSIICGYKIYTIIILDTIFCRSLRRKVIYIYTYIYIYIHIYTKSSNFHLFRIKKIRTSLSRNLTKTLINALVLSRIDYCSSLLNLLPAKATAPLNRIIRSSIRTTYCLTRLDHSTTTSHQSSRMWLPFSLRCKLRILSIIHKSIYSFTPSYISDLIKKRTILSSLRYQNAPLLISQNSSKTSLNSRVLKIPVQPYGIPSLLPFVLLDPTKDL